ncbi:OmpA family protein [Ruficoccus amylovorans]|uniref:OmpA family protein n=1 Tax=Ruficoccus amylovorans TaxID=1804625 RepID=A0A842HG74_9BACT|nr:flagellar motor protein MotB [Ruficoccus amylovorans]MBC2595028.1 OmpA family protein [Ruficoccus amylovorans]
MAKGGAWKVAYADFITAMMALFMVLWILGSEQDLLEHLQEYFRNPPSPFDRESGRSQIDLGDYDGRGQRMNEEAFFDRVDPAILKSIVRDFYRALEIDRELEKSPVEISLTDDGLRMKIFDREEVSLFKQGTDELTPWGTFLVQNLAWLLVRYNFSIVIDGHVVPADMKPGQEGYSVWELSADRANAIRRALDFYSGGDLKFSRVSGYGDSKLPADGNPDTRPQRISLSLSLNDNKPEKDNNK